MSSPRSAPTDRRTLWPPVRVYNAVASRVPRLSRPLGTVAELQRAALVAAGPAADGSGPGALPDDPDAFGDQHYLPGLRAFLDSLAAEADLTPAGTRFARGAVVSALTNRVLIQRALTADPQIGRRPVGPALVVVGLPRSGTTLLQHLLALDPANRSLRQWEASRPSPPPLPGAENVDPRVRAAERATRMLDRLAPAARMLHPTGPRLPTECVTLFTNSFASLEFGAIYQVPGYTSWCLGTDMRPHYAYYADQLRLLARHDHRDRWALKSPAHLFWLGELAEALPQATLIQLHRDPTEVLASYCSLVAVMASTNSRRADRSAIGRFWARAWADGVRRAEQARRSLPADRVHDVRYADLVADPVSTVAQVYEACGLPFTGRFEAGLRAHVCRDRLQPRPRHRYALEDFGLNSRWVREQFEEAGHVSWR